MSASFEILSIFRFIYLPESPWIADTVGGMQKYSVDNSRHDVKAQMSWPYN